MFLSTPPSRVATNLHRGFAGGVRVSIHATLAGGDDVDRLRLADLRGFYPRHPRGWRPGIQRAENGVDIVSIHATLAGGDWRLLYSSAGKAEFLSTPPSRVATGQK